MISCAISKAYTCQPEPSCGEEEEACGTRRKSWSELHQFAPMSMYILRGLQSGLRSASGGSSRAYVVGGSGVGTQADAIQAKGVWVGELSSRHYLLRGILPAA
jgi:hypothetical protein